MYITNDTIKIGAQNMQSHCCFRLLFIRRCLTQNIKILAQIVEMKYKYEQKEMNFVSCLAVNDAVLLVYLYKFMP